MNDSDALMRAAVQAELSARRGPSTATQAELLAWRLTEMGINGDLEAARMVLQYAQSAATDSEGRVVAVYMALVASVKRHVRDRAVLSAIQRDLESLRTGETAVDATALIQAAEQIAAQAAGGTA